MFYSQNKKKCDTICTKCSLEGTLHILQVEVPWFYFLRRELKR
jgi:hypothetical protein